MRRIKKKKTVLIVFIIIAVLVCGFLGTLYYITSTVNNYSYDEKTWINNNSNKTFDVYVEQSLPVFSSNGEGVYYDYLKALKEDSGINLNIITTDTSTLKLTNKNSTSESDIVVYKDHFVVVGRDDVNKLSDLNYKTVGVISSDIDNVTYYLTEYKNITIKRNFISHIKEILNNSRYSTSFTRSCITKNSHMITKHLININLNRIIII